MFANVYFDCLGVTVEPAMARAYESIELEIKERMDGY